MINHPADLYIVANESDNPFAIDVAAHCRQEVDIADLLSLKSFANSEFCPRFISNESDFEHVGWTLRDDIVVIVSTGSIRHTRNELAWRNMLVARAAKDNGAKHVVLVEPDLFFSAQDRGPRPEHGEEDIPRDIVDRKKFDGQPFTSRLYSHVLALAGIDDVITVHNHSIGVQRLFTRELRGRFLNLSPAELFAHYLQSSDVAPCLHNGSGLLICAPDKGARAFANEVFEHLRAPGAQLLYMGKQRTGERDVSTFIDPVSPARPEDIRGKDIIVLDDMVRTGGTIRECCRLLKEAGADRTVFFVTHFQSSPEVRENLHTPELDEIVTTNTIPCILNRDMQGRLRKKMTVLKIEKWLSYYTLDHLGQPNSHLSPPLYAVDMSSKNPRWKQK